MDSITDITGIKVGHAHDEEALTGCTVLLCPPGTIGGIDKRGGGPSSRQTDQLDLIRISNEVHAVLLGGGSAFGLAASTGVMRYLEERGIGFAFGGNTIPIVPAIILFDLGIGRSDVRPDADMGYQACLNASEAPPAQGNVGAGTGASVGKMLGPVAAMKCGLGTASIEIGGGIKVGAIVAVNAGGDVLDQDTGQIIAGARIVEEDEEGNLITTGFADSREILKSMAQAGPQPAGAPENTVIGVVATNAKLSKQGVTKIAQMAQDGLARSIRPAHTMFDGDTIIGLATGEVPADMSLVGTFAAEVFACAVARAARVATGAGGLPAIRDLPIDLRGS